MPTYIVENDFGDDPRIVEARTPAGARQHVAADLRVRKITTRECFQLSVKGLELETAGETAAEPEDPKLPLNPSQPDD